MGSGLAFCLIVDDPTIALRALDQATDLGDTQGRNPCGLNHAETAVHVPEGRLGADADPASRIHELIPHRWKAEKRCDDRTCVDNPARDFVADMRTEYQTRTAEVTSNLGLGAHFCRRTIREASSNMGAQMAEEQKGFWQTIPGFLAGAAAVIGAIATLLVAMKPASRPPETPGFVAPAPSPSPIPDRPGKGHAATPAPPPPLQMSPLQYGVGYDHNDLNPTGWVSLQTPEACSDLCAQNERCKAMTYVQSNRSCWLKFAVGNRVSVSNEVSAVKQ